MKRFIILICTFVTILSNIVVAQNSNVSIELNELVKQSIIDELPDTNAIPEITFNNDMECVNQYKNKIEDFILLSLDKNDRIFNGKIVDTNNKECLISGYYTLYGKVPILIKGVRKKEIIEESNILYTNLKSTNIKQDFILSKDNLIGMQAKRDISPNSFIRESDISKPYVIKDRDAITVVYKKNNMQVKISGVAMQAGAIGDVIKVKNISTNVVLYGKIDSENLVYVVSR